MVRWLIYVGQLDGLGAHSALWIRRLGFLDPGCVHAIFFHGEGVRIASENDVQALANAWRTYARAQNIPLLLCQTSVTDYLCPSTYKKLTEFDESKPNVGYFALSSLAQIALWTQALALRVLAI